MANFVEFGLCAPILTALTAERHIEPTPIQLQTIPEVLAGRDVLGVAQTGTGKTAAFALPILHRLSTNPRVAAPRTCRVLVLSPTRELAAQILERFQAYGRQLRLRSVLVIGGVAMGRQIKSIAGGIDIVIATPGRLVDLMEQGAIQLGAVETLVLDEVDQMLDLGFIHDIRKIAGKLPKTRQSLFFSATMPPLIAGLADKLLANPVKVVAKAVGSTPDRIEQQVVFVEQKDKPASLAQILTRPELTRALVFTRTKRGADKVVRDLGTRGVYAEALHGNKSQPQRERTMAGFRKGSTKVLVATDIAARGIDVEEISHVVNYDLPNVAETYVHRIGRTARAGAAGIAISLCSGEERPFLRDIEKLMRRTVNVATIPRGGAAPGKRSWDPLNDARPDPETIQIAAETEEKRGNRRPARADGAPRSVRPETRSEPRRDPRALASREGQGGRKSLARELSERPIDRAAVDKRHVSTGGVPTGTVKFFNGKKGFGFIACDGGGDDLFVHVKELAGLSGLKEGQRVAFERRIDEQRGKPNAVNVRAA